MIADAFIQNNMIILKNRLIEKYKLLKTTRTKEPIHINEYAQYFFCSFYSSFVVYVSKIRAIIIINTLIIIILFTYKLCFCFGNNFIFEYVVI